MENIIKHERGCAILRQFGWNPHGKPMYRLVRADSRREWQSDVTREWPAAELAPKYPKYGTCWILEKWCAPEKYGSITAWEEAKTLGPFPLQGDYEFVLPLWDGKDQPIYEPGEEHLRFLAWMCERSAGLTRSQRWSHILQEQERAKQERDKKLADMIDDARPMRGGEAERKYAEELEDHSKKMAALGKTNPVPGPAFQQETT